MEVKMLGYELNYREISENNIITEPIINYLIHNNPELRFKINTRTENRNDYVTEHTITTIKEKGLFGKTICEIKYEDRSKTANVKVMNNKLLQKVSLNNLLN